MGTLPRELTYTMGLDNPIHIAFLLILLLVVFGAKRLPEIGKSLGIGMRGFKDSLNGEDPAESPAQSSPQSAPTVQQQGSGPVVASAPAPTVLSTPVEEPVAPVAA
jgi:sec-independent protein translocase protein TatA